MGDKELLDSILEQAKSVERQLLRPDEKCSFISSFIHIPLTPLPFPHSSVIHPHTTFSVEWRGGGMVLVLVVVVVVVVLHFSLFFFFSLFDFNFQKMPPTDINGECRRRHSP